MRPFRGATDSRTVSSMCDDFCVRFVVLCVLDSLHWIYCAGCANTWAVCMYGVSTFGANISDKVVGRLCPSSSIQSLTMTVSSGQMNWRMDGVVCNGKLLAVRLPAFECTTTNEDANGRFWFCEVPSGRLVMTRGIEDRALSSSTFLCTIPYFPNMILYLVCLLDWHQECIWTFRYYNQSNHSTNGSTRSIIIPWNSRAFISSPTTRSFSMKASNSNYTHQSQDYDTLLLISYVNSWCQKFKHAHHIPER